MISSTSCFHCRPPLHHAVADPSIVDLDCRCSALLAERAGCPERVSRRRLSAAGPSTAFHWRRRRLPILRPGGAARKIRWSATPSPDCFECVFVASTSEVGCPSLKRLEK